MTKAIILEYPKKCCLHCKYWSKNQTFADRLRVFFRKVCMIDRSPAQAHEKCAIFKKAKVD